MFGRVFERFQTSFQVLVPGSGTRDWDNAGAWVPGETTEESYEGIIIPFTTDTLAYQEGGTYTNEDIKVYVRPPYFLGIGWTIEHKDREYVVQEGKLYDDFGDYRSYIARRVGSSGGSEASA